MSCRIFFQFVFFIFFSIVSCSQNNTSRNIVLFAGGYTDPGGKGLVLFSFNDSTGEIKKMSEYDAGPNPSYFCISSRKNLLYAINETNDFMGSEGGGLTTMRYDAANDSLKKINEKKIPYGGPCYISISPDSGYLFIANYPKGSVEVIRLDRDGIPGEITTDILYTKDKPEASHAHMIADDPSGKRIFLADLGLDRIIIYNFEVDSGQLIARDTIKLPEKYGPRHFDFSPDGSMLYLVNELSSRLTVISLSAEKSRVIQDFKMVSEEYTGENAAAEIQTGKDGKYVYASNRGENSIVVYKILPDGRLEFAGRSSCGGDWPRNFVISPSGKFLLVANEQSNDIVIFRLDENTGLLRDTSQKIRMKKPVCLKFF
jgi:6-phosphogluconolactonase